MLVIKMTQSPIQLAVLLSGSGTTLQNLVDRISDGSLNAKIATVIASRSGIKGIDRAREAGLPCHLVEAAKYSDVRDFSGGVFKICEQAHADLICLAGWLSLLDVPPAFAGRIMNIHPALLPGFGGKGMYGRHVHQAVLDHGCKISGCTVHFVDRQYDAGPIILQRCCPVLEDDTAESLAHRVFEEEKIAYPQAIRMFQEGRLKIEGRRVRVE
jgi:formyltetrahydrofolate-dependent phosphoribosylglycinamide formyltransferase